jgi:hypothetical protein
MDELKAVKKEEGKVTSQSMVEKTLPSISRVTRSRSLDHV